MTRHRVLRWGIYAAWAALFSSLVLAAVLIYRSYSETRYVLLPRKVKTGLFSDFNMVLGALDFYEKSKSAGLRVDFQESGLYYDPSLGPNWWNYFFEPIDLGSKKKKIRSSIFTSKEKKRFSLTAEFKMPLERAHELIGKYIHVKPFLKEKVDAFSEEHFAKAMIGVHYRGTDKVKESSYVAFDRMSSEVDRSIELLEEKDWKIFVATDDQRFLEHMQTLWPDRIVSLDAARSKDGKAVHLSKELSGFQKGVGAICDCLLLSKCSLLIKTASNLSDCSLQFNPALPAIRLSRCRYGALINPPKDRSEERRTL